MEGLDGLVFESTTSEVDGWILLAVRVNSFRCFEVFFVYVENIYSVSHI